MKKIEAIIRESKVGRVRDALELHGIHGMTITQARGVGAQVGRASTYRGAEYRSDFVTRAKLEIVVDDDHADRVVDTIYETAHTGEIGDGRILISNLEEVVRIRTGEVEGRFAAQSEGKSPVRPRAAVPPSTASPRAASHAYQQSV
jgi:nitrogen regulatory protein P-II 1